MNGSHLEVMDFEGRHFDMSIPRSNNALQNPGFHYNHYAMIYADDHGQVKIASSQSIANLGNQIFTPEVIGHFIEMIRLNPRSMPWNNTHAPIRPSSNSLPRGIQHSPEWIQPSRVRPARMIPCDFQSPQSRRKRHRPMAKPRQKPSLSPMPPSPGRTILRVGNRDLLRQYYKWAFDRFQQLNCRVITKSYIKLIEPRKQKHFPYNGRKVISGIPRDVGAEQTKPAWWPAGVLHREPDHLLSLTDENTARIKLLIHILCELKDSLREAEQDIRRSIDPPSRLQVLDEIYFVRRLEEKYLDGEIDGITPVAVTSTQLPETLVQQDEEFFKQTHVTSVSVLENRPGDGRGPCSSSLAVNNPAINQQGLHLSPATGDSSGPRSPSTTDVNLYTVPLDQMAPSQEFPKAHNFTLPRPHPSYIPTYPQTFIPAWRPAGEYWSDVPSMPLLSQYGY